MYALVIALCCLLAQARQFRPGETEAYNEAVADINGGDFAKAIGAIELWKYNFPDSEYDNERTALYVQAFAGSNQPVKALDAAESLFARDLSTLFVGDGAPAMTLRLLYNVTWAVSHATDPSSKEIATGERAAHQLMDYEKPLPGVDSSKWAEARADMKEKSAAALFYIAMLPGSKAMAKQPPDCGAAELAYSAALTSYPEKASVSWELGRALSCEAKQHPEKFALALYQFERAAALDPTLGDQRNDPKKIRSYADSAYVKYHGSDEGLEQLRTEAKQSPLPAADFTIRNADQMVEEKKAAFERDNPELALWTKIKDRLQEPDGRQYFEKEMKGAGVPQLTGMLLEAKPACRPKELVVQIAGAGVSLKLDKALTGKPELKTPIRWEGVPSAFTPEPFMLTMDTEVSKLEGVKTSPCAAAVTHRKK